MSNFSKRAVFVRTLCCSVALTALAAGVAFGQTTAPSSAIAANQPDQAPPSSATPSNAPPIAPNSTGGAVAERAPPSVSEVVVTGTLLRNVTPAGAESISLDPVAIAATNAISTDQLLASIPQLSSFGTLTTGNSGGQQLTVNRTNIRNLPQGIGGGSPTLVLMDGHRLVGEGVNQSYPDPDIIPPALIQRVDVVTDGGSATYGSDAIGGVINFITKKDFDGFDLGARQGIGNDYYSTDIDATGGKVWSGGGFYVGYTYSTHSPLFGYDRSYVKNIDYTTGLPTYLYCRPGNVVANGVTYASNSGNPLQASTANQCDNAKAAAFYPDEHRDSLLGAFHQKLASNLDFQVKGYYSQRRDLQDSGPTTGSAQVTPTTPGYIAPAGQPGATETAYFNFAGVPNGSGNIYTKLESWGITPTLVWKIGHDWQMTGYYNYGGSKTTVNDPQQNQVLLSSDVTAGLINPYNIAASNPAALAKVLDYTLYGIGEDELQNSRVVFDGPVFSLPGGQIRAAIGGEYIGERFESTGDFTGTYEAAAVASRDYASRNVEAGFGELNIPVVGPQNDIPFIYSLTFAGSERYDHYSDFGGNWAPNVGATYKPVSWIGLRARWNKSFQAPSLVQLANASSPTSTAYPNSFTSFDQALIDPSYPNNGGSIVAVQGTVAPLQPERSRDYNLGFDVSPPVVKGLNIHFTYFNIDYSGQIGTPPLGYGKFFGISTFESLLETDPSIAQLTAFLTKSGVSASAIANTVAQVNAQGGVVYYAADVRARNLGLSLVNGFDISADYHHEVPFGTVFANFNSTYTNNANNAPDGVTFVGNQAGIDGPQFSSATVLGVTVGNRFRGQITWNHLGGFKLTTPVQLNQSSVDAYDTVDAYMQYDVVRPGLPLITLSLGVTNLGDTDPPIYRGDNPGFGAGYANGSTIGRTFQLGANVKF